MKALISLVLVCVGLGLDANGSQNAEIVLGLCFFFGSITLVMPAASLLSLLTNRLFSEKPAHAKRRR